MQRMVLPLPMEDDFEVIDADLALQEEDPDAAGMRMVQVCCNLQA